MIPTIFTMAYREEVFLQFMIDHYREKFPGCKIVLHDNQSPDRTTEIARNNGCDVLEFNTGGVIDDFKVRDLKNNCWKMADTDWVLVCDVDELLDINAEQLEEESSKGTTIIRSEGWNMVNMEDNFDFKNIKHGTRVPQYDKHYLFNKKLITDIHYQCGGHYASPRGIVKLSDNPYKLFHYKCLNPDYLVDRYKWTAQRLSQKNKEYKMGLYWESNESDIRAGFESGREQAKNNKVIE